MTTLQADNRNAKLESLHLAPFHQRTEWGDMKGLAESIRIHGLLVSLLVRERPRSQGGYEIIHGARRHRAAGMAELKLVPIRIVDVDDATAIQMQLDENLQRQDLHALDEAGYYKELSDRGFDVQAIAKRFGKTKREVARRLALHGLSDRARGAFSKGTIDEPAAMALATLDVHARQHDILAALAAGSMQVEEVPGYVAREMQASLDGVPWRLSDERLVAAAGACTNCPKRTSVQRDLFDEVKGDRCRDVRCYRGKMDATYKIEAAKPGVTIHDAEAPTVFVPTSGGRPSVMKSSGMLDAEATCPHMVGCTWREAVEAAQDDENPPTLYLARDQDGRPRLLFRESIVVRLVKRSDAATAQAADREAADPVKPDAGASSPRAEGKIRRAVIDQLVEKAVAANSEVWPWIARRIVENATARSVAQTAGVLEDAITQEAAGLDGKAALLALTDRSNRWAKLVALAVMIYEEADYVGPVPPQLVELAKICELDIEAIERGIRKGPGADETGA